MDGHEARGRRHRQSQEITLNSESIVEAGTILDTLETFEELQCVKCIYPERHDR